MSVRTLPGGALVVWPETLSQTPWLINKSAGGPPFNICIATGFTNCNVSKVQTISNLSSLSINYKGIELSNLFSNTSNYTYNLASNCSNYASNIASNCSNYASDIASSFSLNCSNYTSNLNLNFIA